MRAEPIPAVTSWIAAHDINEIYLTAINEAELLYGVAIMPIGKKRNLLEVAMSRFFNLGIAERILPFDSAASREYAEIAADRRRSGRPIGAADCQIAAICRSRGAVLATRNVRHFRGMGIDVVDPWVSTTDS